ncbi:hypothetical protein HDU82_002172 [Entophlyctis luteolus]|nr:hypothetical protein HDU82_002172 [Entophlyctis luteolus]
MCIHASATLRARKPFLLADIGEGITECEITQWFVKEGDRIEQFAKICEVQSDKASVEITSRFDGVVEKLHYGLGDMAKVGAPLVDIRTIDDPQTADSIGSREAGPAENSAIRSPKDVENPQSREQRTVPFLLADIGEGITECEVVEWFVNQGDKVEQFTKICEVQSDKASVEITSRYDGVIQKLHYKIGDVAKVGSPLVDILVQDTIESPVALVKDAVIDVANNSVATPNNTHQREILAIPAVRALAKNKGIDLSLISGTGKGGRITREDVLKHSEGPKQVLKDTSDTNDTNTNIPSLPQLFLPSQDSIQPLTAVQKAMFKTMTKSLSIPHFGYSDEICIDAASQLRDSINGFLIVSSFKGIRKISYMPIFIKALSLALNEFPILNSKIMIPDGAVDGSNAKLLYRAEHNIGVAMDTPFGLIVPNIKDVQNKSILDIAVELDRLKTASAKGFSNEDLSGGTITLSNIGTIGGTFLHPVIVPNEVCIGAMGRMQRLPRFETVKKSDGTTNDIVVAQSIVPVSWNADHRVIDGATMARFVQKWKLLLESPALISAFTK